MSEERADSTGEAERCSAQLGKDTPSSLGNGKKISLGDQGPSRATPESYTRLGGEEQNGKVAAEGGILS